MVFCSSAVLAEFLVVELRAVAEAKGMGIDRVQGIWASLKATDFSLEFSERPNGPVVADTVCVVVCTSIIGAGFSIDTHFASFYGFLLTGILSFPEEVQFVQRLRFLADGLSANASRQSYIFVQESCGGEFDYERVCINLGAVRGVLGRADRRGAALNDVESYLC